MINFSETIELLGNSHFYYIITTGMDGNFSYINQTYAKAFAYIEPQMLGKPYHITMHPDDTKVCEETSIKCFTYPGQSFPATIRKHDGKGGYLITQWEYRAILDDNNAPQGIFCLGYDVTKYSLTQKQLESAKSEIRKKEHLLKEISWEQSHIIRKPVANILGLVDILSKMDLDQNVTNICSMLAESTKELDEVIKGIVDKTTE